MDILKELDIPEGKKLKSGKVRELFDIDEQHLLIVTTDRLSAFDVILPDPIPDKGSVLNLLSLFWFEKAKPIIKNHLVTANIEKYPPPFCNDERLKSRSMLVRKAEILPIECIVRGYIAGSGWKEYQQKGSVSGIAMPAGLLQSQRLPEPIFSPSTKAEIGEHDENIDLKTAADLVGKNVIEKVQQISLALYRMASEHALKNGIIIADTKFEFGLVGQELIIADEMFTPDSSRFWPKDRYEPGKSQPSFDKQFVRDYLETLNWDKTSPGPRLPADIIEKTRQKYIEAFELITGESYRNT
ncbi:MAG: phosphoribosylaminoimidazolesuccinocarboxamide synthase [Deltaproteobacteria bacterium]|nr:phosphoribosylaminoimidazolesuccinocarboxamide synthase [Deltaproteobacteria bacterium]